MKIMFHKVSVYPCLVSNQTAVDLVCCVSVTHTVPARSLRGSNSALINDNFDKQSQMYNIYMLN